MLSVALATKRSLRGASEAPKEIILYYLSIRQIVTGYSKRTNWSQSECLYRIYSRKGAIAASVHWAHRYPFYQMRCLCLGFVVNRKPADSTGFRSFAR